MVVGWSRHLEGQADGSVEARLLEVEGVGDGGGSEGGGLRKMESSSSRWKRDTDFEKTRIRGLGGFPGTSLFAGGELCPAVCWGGGDRLPGYEQMGLPGTGQTVRPIFRGAQAGLRV